MNSPEASFEGALRDLSQLLEAISGYLDRVVLCGGWAPYFYRHLQLEAAPAHGPLLTHDFDLVAPPDLPGYPLGIGTRTRRRSSATSG